MKVHTSSNTHWLNRWDRMQERYLVARDVRFSMMADLVLATCGAATQGDSPLILDLGCGTGSVMAALLEAVPGSYVVGVDLDPTLLWLAEERLAVYGERAKVIWADLRQSDWVSNLAQLGTERASVAAVVSATALHWLAPDQLVLLYHQIADLLLPGGIFLNADHVASDDPRIQETWERNREQKLVGGQNKTGEDWDSFWSAYLAELGPEAIAERERILGPWNGVEAGQPLAWHFDQLRQAGFTSVDCFWRADCDAIYGGIR